ncbi:MAG: Gfo/Idh/MocA family protein, partial [Dissulfurispiraceae bacterium]
MSKQKQFIGQIGLGYWGKNILRELDALGVLKTACDKDEALLADNAQKYANVRFVNSYEDLIGDPEIMGIAISTPAATHFDLAKNVILAGKDVYVEKPLALTVKE